MLIFRPANQKSARSKQRGAAMMVMLVIMIMGSAAFLVSALNSASVKIERDKKTADALAQAKEALIGRAAIDTTLPGSLPCPNNMGGANDGVADSLSGNDCPDYIGRLPWKTLGLPDLRDSSGAPLWYALSRNFRDNASNTLNSDSTGTLAVVGSPSAVNVVAIVFAAGANLGGQSRSDTQTAACATSGSTIAQNLCAINYLEGNNANASPAATPNTQYVATSSSTTQAGAFTIGIMYTIETIGSTNFTLIGAASNTVGLVFTASGVGAGTGTATPLNNDQIIYITADQLLPIVEMRIAREAKQCLDEYATPANSNKYPWAADVTDTHLRVSKSNVTFGRMPKHKAADPDVKAMMTAIAGLELAVNSCKIENNSANRTALNAAGAALENAAQTVRNNQPTMPAISNTASIPAKSAGVNAENGGMCGDIRADPSGNVVQQRLDTTYAALSNLLSDLIIGCTLLQSSYWNDWKDLLFYKVDSEYAPNGSGAGTPSLQIRNAGNYRATVLMARRAINPQVRTAPTIATNYLESNNATSTNFMTYKIGDVGYQTVNDLVLCLDGKVNCK